MTKQKKLKLTTKPPSWAKLIGAKKKLSKTKEELWNFQCVFFRLQ